MPLSEQEQRLLEEMERSLYHNDSDFVDVAAPRRGRPNYTVLVVGILVGIVGIGILVAGVAVRQPLVGLLGFIGMFAGVLIAFAPPRKGAIQPDRRPKSKSQSSGKPASFMQNLNDRWEKRQDERDQ